MPRYLILAQSETTANALGAWLALLGERGQEEDCEGDDPPRILWDRPVGRAGAMDTYKTLVQRVETATRAGEDRIPLDQVVVLVDSIRPASLDVVEEGWSWDSLIAMLILTFQEIRWVFGVMQGEGQGSYWNRTIAPHHSLTSLLNPTRREPLFDPTGLREWVRSRTNDRIQRVGDDLKLPTRWEIAAAIEEERPYAYLHGYTAYRFGCRADTVMTWAAMKERFQCTDDKQSPTQADKKSSGHGYWLLLEDMSLNFADRPQRVHLHCLETERKEHCAWLDSSDKEGSAHRILVTTGQTRPKDPALSDNRRYLREKKEGRGSVVLKPTCGMFDLWEKSGLLRRWKDSRRRGDVEGFVWPPLHPRPAGDEKSCEERSESNGAGNAQGHGTIGKLLLVSEALIKRAKALTSRVECASEAVQGAVLATDALELTGGRTPTTAIEALSLKQRFELLAECQFSGVEHHISLHHRFDEINLETRAICRWFARRQRERATLNARMHILNQLVDVFQMHNQFDEERTCVNRVRYLHATLWMRDKPWRYVFWLPIRYVEWLLSSFLVFVSAVAVWILVLGILFAFANPDLPAWNMDRLATGLRDAITSFFSVGSPIRPGSCTDGLSNGEVIMTSVSIMSGFLHLGVLISHLYSIITRK
ncbi:hypothetical protein [Candidatus Thiosymbion oneisti]|uniref:hypothetical protein n=1 Tax=Candidatus Thiosymbion oneisti TaxID=589554 RepID=UPI000B7D7B59|nr:hypothetical protein [Candidatus Thiosymbion oneisti]